jgi:hypothetical protein
VIVTQKHFESFAVFWVILVNTIPQTNAFIRVIPYVAIVVKRRKRTSDVDDVAHVVA